MYRAPKNNPAFSWRPSASINNLRVRARLLARIREFFASRDIMEVETPLLFPATVTDPHIGSIPAHFKKIGSRTPQILYLQTSPEYAMKRLLASGSGSIYQISKAFRQGEIGRHHNPEFTMLEWYREGFDHHALMNDVDAFLQEILTTPQAKRFTVQQVFENYLHVNPHQASVLELTDIALQNNIFYQKNEDKNAWLDILFTHCIEPHLGKEVPIFLYDFPCSQAALAKIRSEENPPVASRFEVYFKGIELANGFHELQDPSEQRKRFEKDLQIRQQKGLERVPIDEQFLAALEAGLPDCAGVALGIDRLMMLATSMDAISKVISFAHILHHTSKRGEEV